MLKIGDDEEERWKRKGGRKATEKAEKTHLDGVKGVGRRGKPSATLQQSIRDEKTPTARIRLQYSDRYASIHTYIHIGRGSNI